MAYRLITKNFTYWSELLQNLWEGHNNSGTPLRDDLKSEVETAKDAFPDHLAAYSILQADENQERRMAKGFQKQSIKAISGVRFSLTSLAGKENKDMALQLYNFDKPKQGKRLLVLARLQQILEITEAQPDDGIKPAAEVLATVNTLATELRQAVDKINALVAQGEQTRRDLAQEMADYAVLRERVYAYLVTVLPAGPSDPKLIDYGLRRKFTPRRSSTKVTVVNEEVETPVTP